MGETAVRGADTPRYRPRMPSLRSVLVLESMPKTLLLLLPVAPASSHADFDEVEWDVLL